MGVSLVMRRSRLDALPALMEPPVGFVLRLAHDDDREPLAAVLAAAFPEMAWDATRVDSEFLDDPNVPATFVVEYDGQVVATASALFEADSAPATGVVHWVAVHPAQAGKRLGYIISLAVLHEFARRGCRDALLRTDDHRLAAIRTYLNLGFLPDHEDPTHLERWVRVNERLAAYRVSENSPASRPSTKGNE
jgi:mycothiol synthase